MHYRLKTYLVIEDIITLLTMGEKREEISEIFIDLRAGLESRSLHRDVRYLGSCPS